MPDHLFTSFSLNFVASPTLFLLHIEWRDLNFRFRCFFLRHCRERRARQLLEGTERIGFHLRKTKRQEQYRSWHGTVINSVFEWQKGVEKKLNSSQWHGKVNNWVFRWHKGQAKEKKQLQAGINLIVNSEHTNSLIKFDKSDYIVTYLFKFKQSNPHYFLECCFFFNETLTCSSTSSIVYNVR